MILSKLYSNDERFKTINFNEGFNFIVARYNKKNANDTHGLGKTTISILIDFMLLKEIKGKHFLNDKIFNDYIFYLEIKLNSGKYLTIKRSVEKRTKISFQLHDEGKQDFTTLEEWDIENLSFKKSKCKLNEYLSYNTLEEYPFRKFLKFVIRTQNDYTFYFKKDEVKDKDWKPQILSLFGINPDNSLERFLCQSEFNKLEELYKESLKDDTPKLEELKQLKTTLERDVDRISQKIETFDYYEIDSDITDEAADEINQKINNLNRNKFNLSVDISNIKESLENMSSSIDLESLEDLFKEVNIYFVDNLKKDYNSLVEFNKQISSERDDYLKQSLENKYKRLEVIESELEGCYGRQKEILNILSAQKEVQKILLHQKELHKFEIQVSKLEKEIEFLERAKAKFKEYQEMEIKIKQLNLAIGNDIDAENSLKDKIITLLNEISEKIFFDLTTVLTITQNGAGNPNFDLKLKNIAKGIITNEEAGSHKGKFMRGSFDLALLISYLDKSYHRFLFHDGIIEAADHRMKEHFIKTVKEYIKEYNFQYITTAIEDEIKDIEDLLDINDIILELNDSEDHSGTLFGFKF